MAVASDQGKGLVAHIKKGLGAHAAPDVFHVMHDLWKGLGRPLAASLSAPEQALEAARSTLARCQQSKADYWADWRRPPERFCLLYRPGSPRCSAWARRG